MTRLMSCVFLSWAAAVSAAPLPGSVEKINKEGIEITKEVVFQGQVSGQDLGGVHLLRLHKDQAVVFELGDHAGNWVLKVEGPDGKIETVAPDKKTYRAAREGTFRVRLVPAAKDTAKYSLTIRPLPPSALPPGVHVVGPGGLTINASLALNDPVDNVRKNCHCKTYDVKMQAGRIYTITMSSRMLDSYLRLEDFGGKQLAVDDDGGGNLDARIVFRPAQDGVFRVITTSFGRSVGDYTLKIAEQ